MGFKIFPLLSVDEKILSDLKEEIGKTFLTKVEIGNPLGSLPDYVYDKGREQYHAGKLVNFLSTYVEKLDVEKLIFVCNFDLFVPDLNFVFGVAQRGGKICLISLFRLDQRFYNTPANYKKLRDRAVKEAIHELGHCFGLDHCRKEDCVMSFSNEITLVDQKKNSFCEDCRGILRKMLN
jgi:archaemetzincin